MNKRSIKNADVSGKKVLVRVDFNVPMRDGVISDDSRIRAVLPTLNFLKDGGAKVVICSHFGRPNGQVVEEMRLRPVRERLSELLGVSVADAGGPNSEHAAHVILSLSSGEFALLENLRFEFGEEKNEEDFSKQLASFADLYVNDAFGVAHRAHASTVGVTEYLPSYAGFLM